MADRNELMNRARNELFSHINHCEVIDAATDHQEEWMTETIEYLAERYPELGDQELSELHQVGMRFCQPPIRHGRDATVSQSSE